MSPPSLEDFLAQNGLKAGDLVHIEWKGVQVEGTILPPSNQNKSFLHIKLPSGYNTGLGIAHISRIEKMDNGSVKNAFGETAKNNAPPIEHAGSESKPGLSLVAAGGTIGSKTDYKTGGVSALMTSDELMALIPEIGGFAHFHSILSPFSKLSENMGPQDWIQLATICHHELNKPEVKGVLLTHGTDTLHYTAAALSFMLRNVNKPVVLIGAQRSSDRGSSDATLNLIEASRIALSDAAEVGICMHGTTSDDYCLFNRGTRVRKMHSSRRDAFRPINDLPIAKINAEGKIDFFGNYRKRDETKKVELDAVFEEKIGLIKSVPGKIPCVIEHFLSQGIKGIVIEGTGLGHVSEAWIPSIKKAMEQNVSIFITSQTIYGRVNLNVYSTGRMMQEAGAVGLEDMLSEVAYVKLGWVLGHTKDIQKVKEMMLTSYAGEISPTSRTDTFLY